MPEVGQVFGGYEFLRVVGRRAYASNYIDVWEVKCLTCEEIREVGALSAQRNKNGCPACGYSSRRGFQIGSTVGGFLILGNDQETKVQRGTGQNFYEVQCLSCLGTFTRAVSTIKANVHGCKSCGSRVVHAGRVGSKATAWRGGRFISGALFCQIRKGAAVRSLPFEVSVEYLDRVWEEQQGRCVYTGRYLTIGNRGTETTASLDRIDSKRGYVEGNVQFVHKVVNIAKYTQTHEEFIAMCKEVTERASG